MGDWHSKDKKEVLKALNTTEDGLTKSEAKARVRKYGKNVIGEKKTTSLLFVFLKQFNNTMIYILLAAAVISYFFENLIDMYVILFVVMINASIGFVQEYKTENAIKALKKLVVSYAKVYRDNELLKIPSTRLIPGDVILLEEGDRIPSDCYLLKIKNGKQ